MAQKVGTRSGLTGLRGWAYARAMTNTDTATEVSPLSIGQQYIEAHNLIARAERYEDRAVTCSRCFGSGRMPFTFAGGICFKCDGTRGQKADEALMD